MTKADIAYCIAWLDLMCWGVCFWWMHRISQRQDRMLADLHSQAKRIEDLSKAEHELIKEVHPNVDEIKERVANVADVIAEAVQEKPSSTES